MFKSASLLLLLISFLHAVPVKKEESENDVTFKYVTFYNQEGYYITINDLYQRAINVLKPVTFIINGIHDAEKGNNSWYTDLMEAFTKRNIHNVFIVDWKIPTEPSDVKSGIVKTGNAVAEFIEALYNKTGEIYLDIHLVGVVLGSEVAGIAGGRSQELTGKKVNRITALDPYYYLINDGEARKATPKLQLSKENAKLVDVLHSNLNELNEFEPLGHVDYYLSEKDCQQNKEDSAKKCRINGIELFAKSVNSKEIEAVKCASVDDYTKGNCKNGEHIVFGEDVPQESRGAYIV